MPMNNAIVRDPEWLYHPTTGAAQGYVNPLTKNPASFPWDAGLTIRGDAVARKPRCLYNTTTGVLLGWINPFTLNPETAATDPLSVVGACSEFDPEWIHEPSTGEVLGYVNPLTNNPELFAFTAAEAQALFDRMSSQPNAARKSAINTMIGALKATGVWANLDVLQVYAAHDSQAALLNWVSPSFNATAVGSPAFTADYGYTTNGSSNYLNTGCNPSALTVSGLNDAFMMVSPLKARQQPISYALSGSNQSLVYFTTDTSFFFSLNAGTSGADNFTVAESIHYIATERTSASASKAYGREEISSVFTRASTAITASSFYVGARNLNNTPDIFTAMDVCAFAYGKAIGDAGHAALQNALSNYMYSLGAWKRPLSCWGDSRTQGATQTPYPTAIRVSSSDRRITHNGGVSGETSTQIKNRFLADTTRINKDWVPVIWAGYNNRNAVSTVLADIAAMVAHCNTYYGGRYLVLNIPASRDPAFYPGTTDGDNIAAINTALAAAYPDRLVDVCTPLYAGDPNNVMAAAYVINTVTDFIHCNTAGLALVASAVESKAASFGW